MYLLFIWGTTKWFWGGLSITRGILGGGVYIKGTIPGTNLIEIGKQLPGILISAKNEELNSTI